MPVERPLIINDDVLNMQNRIACHGMSPVSWILTPVSCDQAWGWSEPHSIAMG